MAHIENLLGKLSIVRNFLFLDKGIERRVRKILLQRDKKV
jgi:hypothetical protein